MIYRVGSRVLHIPQHSDRLAVGTTVAWRDVAETCRCLHAVSRCVCEKPGIIADGIAGCGFWGAVFLEVWPDVSLHLNETEVACQPLLKQHFPYHTISNFDLHEWNPPHSDIGLLEFPKFTLKLVPQWVDVLAKWSAKCRRLILADGACFGFKFGNLRSYGAACEEAYYRLLSKALRQITRKHLTVVSKFTNAAIVLLEDTRRPMQFVAPSTSLVLVKDGRWHLGHTSKGAYKKEGLWTGTGPE